MSIETLSDWNTRLGYCGCCTMYVCPTPSLLCESRSAILNEDEDSLGQAFEEEHAQWIIDGDAWILANSDPPTIIKTRADYIAAGFPEPVVPPLTKYGAWARFDRPIGEDEDPIPEIYRKVYDDPPSANVVLYTGTAGAKTAQNDWNYVADPDYVQYSLSDTVLKTFTSGLDPNGPEGVTRSAVEATYNAGGVIACDPIGSVNNWPDVVIDDFDILYLPDLPWFAGVHPWVESIPKSYTVSGGGAVITYVSGTWTLDFGAAQVADACPGPWGQPAHEAFLEWEWADTTAKGADKPFTLSDPITRAQLKTKTDDELVLADWEGGSCVARYVTSWPEIGSFNWTVSNEILHNNAFELNNQRRALAYIQLIEARPRFKISYDHAGSYFKITYDILDEPFGWDDMIDDPDYIPPDPLPEPPPPIPQIPRPGRPLRTFLSEDTVVTWTGPGTPVPALLDPDPDPGPPPTPEEIAANIAARAAAELTWLTPKFTIATPVIPGERRVVNIRYICYHGTKFGVKPQVMGEAVILPDVV